MHHLAELVVRDAELFGKKAHFGEQVRVQVQRQQLDPSAYVSIRQHTSAYISIRQHTSVNLGIAGETVGEVF